jgi:hypothetical protein
VISILLLSSFVNGKRKSLLCLCEWKYFNFVLSQLHPRMCYSTEKIKKGFACRTGFKLILGLVKAESVLLQEHRGFLPWGVGKLVLHLSSTHTQGKENEIPSEWSSQKYVCSAYFYNQTVCVDFIIDNLNVLYTSYIKHKGLLVSVSYAFKMLILIFNAPNSHLNLKR